jgi:hypothetical protein
MKGGLYFDLFSIKVRQRLKGNFCPVYVFGNYQVAPLVMFGINPGYSYLNSPIEDNEARKFWEDYQNLHVNFFTFFHNLIAKYDKMKITGKFNVYFFEIRNIPCVMFDTFSRAVIVG